MLNYYEQKALLSQKNIKGYVYVWSGCGYSLQKIGINKNELSIEELAFICIKTNKGCFIYESDMTEIENRKFEIDESYYYCDMSLFGIENGYLLIENMKADDNIELHS